MKQNGMLNSFLEIFQRRELVLELTKRQLTISHKGSTLGFIWVILTPLLLLSIYMVVFGYIFQGKFESSGNESRLEYGLTIFLGLTVIHFLNEILSAAPRCMFAHANFLTRTTIPSQIIPVSAFLTAVFHLVVSTILILIGHLVLQRGLSINSLWVFPIFLNLLILGLGLCWLLASLGTLFKDIGEFVPSLSIVILFGSAVFYPVNQVPPEIWTYLKYNPVLHIVNELRSTFLWNNPINLRSFGYIAACSIFCLISGWLVFHFSKHKLNDIV